MSNRRDKDIIEKVVVEAEERWANRTRILETVEKANKAEKNSM
jgi:hypothetical protein